MAERRPKVVYWNNQPSPYVVDRFNAVVDAGAVDLEVWFDRERESDRSWHVDPATWRFRARFLDTNDASSIRARVPVAALAATRPDVFVTNYDRAHMALGLLAGRRYAQRVAIRCLPTWPAWVPPVPRQELAKHLLFRSVDGAKVPGPDGAAYALKYGLTPERIWTVTQSVDVEHFAAARALRAVAAPSLDEPCRFLYVGRIWSGKGLDDLLDAYRWVRKRDPNVRLRVVGDGPDEHRLRHATRDMPDVEWGGFVQPRDLPAVYAAADVFVFPTLGDPNGLVVEEAMAAGLPVLSTAAAGDIRRRVVEGETGYVVEPAHPQQMAHRMLELAQDRNRRERMGRTAFESVTALNPLAYATDFVRFANELLAMPRRHNVVGEATKPFAVAATLGTATSGRG